MKKAIYEKKKKRLERNWKWEREREREVSLMVNIKNKNAIVKQNERAHLNMKIWRGRRGKKHIHL